MRFENVEELKEEPFRRLTGVKRKTFDAMVIILQEAESKKKSAGGKPNKLSIADRLLIQNLLSHI